MRRWPQLDGVRGIAALLVVLTHVGFWTGANARGVVGAVLSRGEIGVAVFFALSAFLLSGPLLQGRGRLTDYARRRLARLLPAYAVALAAVLALAAAGVHARGPFVGTGGAEGLGGPTRVLAHLLVAQGLVGGLYQSFSQTWSLTTEVLFYVALPVLALVLRRASPRARWLLVAGVAVLGFVVQGVAARQGWTALALSPLGHGAWFAVGLLVRLLADRPALTAPATGWLALGLAIVALAAVSTPIAGPRLLGVPTMSQALAREALFALFAAGLMTLGVTRGAASAWLSGGLPRGLGRISYGVFLWHLVVLQVVYAATGLRLFTGHLLPVLTATLVLSLALGWLSWRFIESAALARSRASSSIAPPARR